MRFVVHLDADAFFASVEQAADPRLRGKAIAVGGEQRGIIASASYEARRMGIYTPMPTSRARKLCPKLIILPGDYEKYERFSQWMFSYAYDFTPDVEVTSIDEGYLDLTPTHKDPVSIARTLRQAIHQSLKISVSEGIGSNKLVSQIASKLNKPAAFFQIPSGTETNFLHPLPNRWLPGVGPVTSSRLNAAGLSRIGQIAATPTDLLEMLVGSGAPTLRQFAQGKDDRPIIPARPSAKSYGQQETFNQDQTDEAFLEATLRRMADHLMAKVRSDGKSVRTLTVKVRYNDMDEDQCSESLAEPTDLETDIYSRLPILLRNAWRRRVSLRLVSLKLSQVYEGIFRLELALDRASQQSDAQRRLSKAVDELRQARGHRVILRGHDFILREAPPALAPATSAVALPTVSRAISAPMAVPRTSPSTHPLPALRLPSSVRYTIPRATPAIAPIPLRVRSHYSFLNSTLSPEAIVELAEKHQHGSIALCDLGNLHGAVELAQAAKSAGIRPLFGAEVRIDGQALCLYVENAIGYANLCRLLSQTVSSAERPGTLAASALETERCAGLIGVSPHPDLARHFPKRFYLGVRSDKEWQRHAAAGSFPSVAMSAVHYESPDDRWKYDILQSIRTLTLLRQPHPLKVMPASFHHRPAREIQERFRELPSALSHTHEIAERCSGFTFPLGPPQFPAYLPPNGESAREFLRRLVFDGARRRYPGNRWQTVCPQLETELQIIHEVGYEEYFLVVWDLLQECRHQGISWITRGSAADSLVCYCLEISGVCPIRFDLYFRRFLNRERMALQKLPDIDVDFPHDRKDDVVDLLFAKYGPAHCAVVGGFSTFQARSAVGEVAKVLGVSEHQVRRFTEHFPWSFGGGWGHASSSEGSLIERLKAMPECQDLPLDEEPYRSALVMGEFLDGVPRYPKMHPCGVVLSRQPIHELTPTFVSGKGYVTTHYDMDGVEAIGLVKMDILAQGGLAVMRDVEGMLNRQGIQIDLESCTLRSIASPSPPPAIADSTVPIAASPSWSDPLIWEMIASGGARAVHHIESPAMTTLCRMCQVQDIDGLIAIVSVIRPGAANEHKKVRFTRRYQGLEAPTYPHPSLEPCLRSTFGLVVYEEHILQICEAFAGLSGGRADVLRRALVKQQLKNVEIIGQEFATSALARGHSPELIREVWELVTGFNGYAFCKAHSTAYGVEAYQSAWLKLNFPAEFMAAVLTQGKGFYSPLVYILECHRLGIAVLPPWINEPGPDFRVPSPAFSKSPAIRIPVSYVKHLREITLERLFHEHQRCPFENVRDFYLRVRPNQEEIEALLKVGAFDGFSKPRTTLFWELQQVHHTFGSLQDPDQGWLLPPPGLESLPEVPLTEPTRLQRLQWETELLGFTASGHPLELYPQIAWNTYCPVNRLGEYTGQEIVTCGLIIEQRLHHQATGEPMKFLTLCDGTGMVETELFAATYRSYGLTTVRYPVLEITARVEPFENGRGHTLRVMRAGKPRENSEGC
ncbi:MAG: DNA polymerase III subunit alpha [Verrucomicrobiales bacterium]|nr:DNA polymerase III subunit alpha [Verrucomicrobiales bacterium]